MCACVSGVFFLGGLIGACVSSYEIDLAAGPHRTFDLDFFLETQSFPLAEAKRPQKGESQIFI